MVYKFCLYVIFMQTLFKILCILNIKISHHLRYEIVFVMAPTMATFIRIISNILKTLYLAESGRGFNCTASDTSLMSLGKYRRGLRRRN